MICPNCGEEMTYMKLGVKFDGDYAMGWRCTKGKARFNHDCWCTIYDGERPWALEMTQEMRWQWIRDTGAGPGEWMEPPTTWLAEYEAKKKVKPKPRALPTRTQTVDDRQLALF